MSAALEILAAAWTQPFPKEQVAVYVEFLADIPEGELNDAVSEMITTQTFRPSVATIRRKVLDRRGVIPTLDEASVQVEALDQWNERVAVPRGAGPKVPPMPDVHPAVVAAWRIAGPWSLPAVFAKAYRETAEQATNKALASRFDGPRELAPGS